MAALLKVKRAGAGRVEEGAEEMAARSPKRPVLGYSRLLRGSPVTWHDVAPWVLLFIMFSPFMLLFWLLVVALL
jgi:hypothetical protein